MQAQLQSQTSRDFASTKMQTRQATTTARESNSSDNALSSMSENAFAATLPARSLQQQQQQQQLATSGYKLAPPSATAATAKIRPTAATMMKSAPSLSATMTLPSRSAVAKKQVTRSLSPSASATSAANATTTSAACPSSYLRSSFKIGSTHGRMNFDDDERVFHRSDAPQKAVSVLHTESESYAQWPKNQSIARLLMYTCTRTHRYQRICSHVHLPPSCVSLCLSLSLCV